MKKRIKIKPLNEVLAMYGLKEGDKTGTGSKVPKPYIISEMYHLFGHEVVAERLASCGFYRANSWSFHPDWVEVLDEEIDLRACKPGDKVFTRDGEEYTYVNDQSGFEKFPHLLKGEYHEQTATHNGLTQADQQPWDHDFIKIVRKETEMKIDLALYETANPADKDYTGCDPVS